MTCIFVSINCLNWLYVSTSYGFSCHAKYFLTWLPWLCELLEETKSIKINFCSWSNWVKWIQDSIQQLFCKMLKNVSVSHFKILESWHEIQGLASGSDTTIIVWVQINSMLFKFKYLNFRMSHFFVYLLIHKLTRFKNSYFHWSQGGTVHYIHII